MSKLTYNVYRPPQKQLSWHSETWRGIWNEARMINSLNYWRLKVPVNTEQLNDNFISENPKRIEWNEAGVNDVTTGLNDNEMIMGWCYM
jgi:hypothetical protein